MLEDSKKNLDIYMFKYFDDTIFIFTTYNNCNVIYGRYILYISIILY